MKDTEHTNHPSHPFQLIFIVVAIASLSLSYAIGSWIADSIFAAVQERPSGFVFRLIPGIFGVGIFLLGSLFFRYILTQLHKDQVQESERSPGMQRFVAFGDTISKALERIAHGDFGVLIPVDRHDPFSEIAESVNKMAQELGSMESLRQDFISNVSHEIQSPLTSISGFAKLLKNPDLPMEQRNHYLEIIETESKRLSKLSDTLLKLSALDSESSPLKRATFRLDKQIESAILMLEPQWGEKNLELSLILEKTEYNGDEDLLTQVWVNLLHNAIKFTPVGGRIDMRLSKEEEQVCCTITDTGIGISKEDMAHLFERFYKVDKARDRSLGGNGLGLSLVKKIVELHAGRIEMQSEIGKGTTFAVALPIENIF